MAGLEKLPRSIVTHRGGPQRAGHVDTISTLAKGGLPSVTLRHRSSRIWQKQSVALPVSTDDLAQEPAPAVPLQSKASEGPDRVVGN